VDSLLKQETNNVLGALGVSFFTPFIYLQIAGLYLLKTKLVIHRLWKDTAFSENTFQLPDTKSLIETIIPLIGLYYFLFAASHAMTLT